MVGFDPLANSYDLAIRSRPSIIVIGASAGGVAAVQEILQSLDPGVSAPIVVVQHLAKTPRGDLTSIYLCQDGRPVVEVEDKMSLKERVVYMAAPDYHVLLERDGSFSLSQDDPVHFSRPSIDVLFETAASVYGAGAVGILLTGANKDGAEGLCRIREAGGVTIVQSPSTAEVAVMPQAALDLCEHDEILSLDEIGSYLKDLFMDSKDGTALRRSNRITQFETEKGYANEDQDTHRR